MSEDRRQKIETLRQQVKISPHVKLRRHYGPAVTSNQEHAPTTALNIPAIDAVLPKTGLSPGTLHEIIPAEYPDFSATVGFLLCLLHTWHKDTKAPILWCHTDGYTDVPNSLYPHGLQNLGIEPARLLHVAAKNEKDMLWALEEGLSSNAFPLIIGCYSQKEKLYDFTASRRLSLRASRQGSTVFILRHHKGSEGKALNNTTAATTRWQVRSAPSRATYHRNARMPAMGRPRWHITLTKCKGGKAPSNWQLEWDHETLSLYLVSRMADRKPAVQPKQTQPAYRYTEQRFGA